MGERIQRPNKGQTYGLEHEEQSVCDGVSPVGILVTSSDGLTGSSDSIRYVGVHEPEPNKSSQPVSPSQRLLSAPVRRVGFVTRLLRGQRRLAFDVRSHSLPSCVARLG
jgi:hypothetical protein